jgi:hypothetical protein
MTSLLIAVCERDITVLRRLRELEASEAKVPEPARNGAGCDRDREP